MGIKVRFPIYVTDITRIVGDEIFEMVQIGIRDEKSSTQMIF